MLQIQPSRDGRGGREERHNRPADPTCADPLRADPYAAQEDDKSSWKPKGT
jgi:hypothetical protein